MKPKTMILMGLAIVCGLGASYMTSRLLAERQPDAPETVEILVAKRNLSVHERINNPDDMFETKTVSKENEPADAIRDLEALKGKVLRQGRNKGDHITAASLYDKFVGLEIPEGHQAVGLRVNLETAGSGLFTLPGSYVNLILTIRGNDARSLQTQVLLQNVLVLAADIKVNSDGEIAAPAQVVTFALKDEDALTLTGAKEMGIISLVLRKRDDHTITKSQTRSGSDILDRGKKKEEPIIAKAETPTPEVTKPIVPPTSVEVPVVSKNTKHEIVIVHGTKSGQYKVEKIRYELTEDGEVVNETSQTSEAQTPPAASGRLNGTQPATPRKGGSSKEF